MKTGVKNEKLGSKIQVVYSGMETIKLVTFFQAKIKRMNEKTEKKNTKKQKR